jgi:hypothetical protein
MTPARAAEVLRGIDRDALICEEHDALRMGAEALELLAWINGHLPNGSSRVGELYNYWPVGIGFLDYCKAEWEKERKIR